MEHWKGAALDVCRAVPCRLDAWPHLALAMARRLLSRGCAVCRLCIDRWWPVVLLPRNRMRVKQSTVNSQVSLSCTILSTLYKAYIYIYICLILMLPSKFVPHFDLALVVAPAISIHKKNPFQYYKIINILSLSILSMRRRSTIYISRSINPQPINY